MTKVKRGDVFLANLSDATGSEQAFVRPVVIIQNNCGNKHSPTTIVACLSSNPLHSSGRHWPQASFHGPLRTDQGHR